VGLEHVAQLEPELAHQLEVAIDLLAYWIDQRGHASDRIGDEVRVRRALGVEQLADQHARDECTADASRNLAAHHMNRHEQSK